MTPLIEILCSLSQEEAVQKSIEESCEVTGDVLIGRQVSKETGEVHFIVKVLERTSVSKHAAVMSRSRSYAVMASLRFIACDLLHISFSLFADPPEQMRDFPLRPGESWFPAIHDPRQVYVCMSRPLVDARQAAWLLENQVEWAYV